MHFFAVLITVKQTVYKISNCYSNVNLTTKSEIWLQFQQKIAKFKHVYFPFCNPVTCFIHMVVNWSSIKIRKTNLQLIRITTNFQNLIICKLKLTSFKNAFTIEKKSIKIIRPQLITPLVTSWSQKWLNTFSAILKNKLNIYELSPYFST